MHGTTMHTTGSPWHAIHDAHADCTRRWVNPFRVAVQLLVSLIAKQRTRKTNGDNVMELAAWLRGQRAETAYERMVRGAASCNTRAVYWDNILVENRVVFNCGGECRGQRDIVTQHQTAQVSPHTAALPH